MGSGIPAQSPSGRPIPCTLPHTHALNRSQAGLELIFLPSSSQQGGNQYYQQRQAPISYPVQGRGRRELDEMQTFLKPPTPRALHLSEEPTCVSFRPSGPLPAKRPPLLRSPGPEAFLFKLNRIP